MGVHVAGKWRSLELEHPFKKAAMGGREVEPASDKAKAAKQKSVYTLARKRTAAESWSAGTEVGTLSVLCLGRLT